MSRIYFESLTGLKLSLLIHYYGRFRDESPSGWNLSLRDEVVRIGLPNDMSFEIGTNDSVVELAKIWSHVPRTDASSTILWRNSLRGLLLFLDEESVNWGLIASLLESFERYLSAHANNLKLLKSGSLDHQSALRLRVYCSLLSRLASEDVAADTASRIVSLVRRLIRFERRLTFELGLFEPNNHGIMLGIAWVHTETVLGPVLSSTAGDQDWLERVVLTLDDLVDKDGLLPENTPSYQILYINLIKGLLDFVRWAELLPSAAGSLENMHERCILALRRTLLPSGEVPPLGDSPGGMQHRFAPELGTFWSPKNGLFVHSTQTSYVSLVAGFRSVIHKQIDDGSVTWWSHGSFVLRDAGLKSYDKSDPVATMLRTQRGHSMTGFSANESLAPERVISYGRNASRVRGELVACEAKDGQFWTKCEVDFLGRGSVSRTVTGAMNSLVIDDSIQHGEAGPALSRFLFDPSLRFGSFSERGVTLLGPDRSVEVCVSQPADLASELRLEGRQTFVAVAPYRVVEAPELLVHCPAEGPTTRLIATLRLIHAK